MTQELMQNNIVTLSGKIVAEPVYSHRVYSEGFYESFIEVKRLSEQTDIIPITLSDRLIEDAGLSVGDYVTIYGQFRSYNKLIDNRSKLMLTVFVREILDFDAEINPNKIELYGFLCKEPVYRTTPFKREICDLLVAVNRAYNKSDYIPCIAWGRNARFAKNLATGDKIALSGRIQSREYQKQVSEGVFETRTAYEISLNRIGLDDGEDYED